MVVVEVVETAGFLAWQIYIPAAGRKSLVCSNLPQMLNPHFFQAMPFLKFCLKAPRISFLFLLSAHTVPHVSISFN